MILETFKNFSDFELLDTGDGYRLERWGQAILKRPDPQIIWQPSLPEQDWKQAHAAFLSASGDEKGKWQVSKSLPDPWVIEFQGTKFRLKLSPFKHTGLFAEQAAQWEWTTKHLQTAAGGKKLRVLNLFGYTGGATMVLAKAGCFVTHVDASKPTITWANENHELNRLPKESVRWMLDDAVKFVKRELKRGSLYDGIVMDPPAFGHSPTGKVWKFNQHLPELLQDCVQLMSQDARFLVINGYATNSSSLALQNVLEDAMRGRQGSIESGELCLKQRSGRLISTGIFARWSAS